VDLAIDSLRLLFQSKAMNNLPIQAVFLGTGDPIIEQAVQRLAMAFPDLVCAKITYDEKLSRLIYAGADMFLMPSRYEPCGLSQMIAMHYGCLPIARATGGLSDTILDPNNTGQGTGFLFKPSTYDALAGTIQRALMVYTKDPRNWQAMQICAMQQDFSWNRSALEYIKLYKTLLDRQPAH
jgi:starch synthase